jgi:thioredoxin reductase (NADPH)
MSQKMQKNIDVVVIGAGPNGLACGIELARRDINYLIIDKGSIVDSVRRFPVNMKFFSTAERIEIGNIPFTIPEVQPSRLEAVDYYRKVAEHFNLQLSLFRMVTKIEPLADYNFKVHTDKGDVLSRFVIVATGYFDDPLLLNVSGEDLSHVSHYYTEAYEYYGRKVVIVGGRNTAVETALDLFRAGVDVTIVHRGSGFGDSVKYWLKPDIENRVAEGAIKVHFNTEIKKILPNEVVLENQNGETQVLVSDKVLLLSGYSPKQELLQSAGVPIDARNRKPEIDAQTFETSLKGLFVAGSAVSGAETRTVFIENGRGHAKVIAESIVAAMATFS